MQPGAILNVRRTPKRVDSVGAAELLGMKVEHIPPLVAAKLLKPLGNPSSPNAVKWFFTEDLLAVDREWMDKACKVISNYYKKRNSQNGEKTEKFLSSDNHEAA